VRNSPAYIARVTEFSIGTWAFIVAVTSPMLTAKSVIGFSRFTPSTARGKSADFMRNCSLSA